MVAGLGGLEDAFLAGLADGGAGQAGHVAEGLQGRFHVGGHGGGHRDLVLGDGVLEAQQLGVQGLTVQERALHPVDLVAQEGVAAVGELHADLVAAAGLQLDFHHGVAGQALDHAVVGDRFLGTGGHALAAAGALALLGHGHLEGLGVLDEVARQGATVLRQLTHQHRTVDPLQAMELEELLEAVDGLRGLGEDQDAAGEAVQAVDDEQVEALEAAAPVGLGDGLSQAGLAALLRRHREQAGGFEDEHQVVVFPQGLVGAGLELAGRR